MGGQDDFSQLTQAAAQNNLFSIPWVTGVVQQTDGGSLPNEPCTGHRHMDDDHGQRTHGSHGPYGQLRPPE